MTVTQPGNIIATVTGQDLLGELRALTGQVGEVKQAVAGISPALTEHQRMLDSHAAAIRSLEQRWAFLAGIGAVITLLMGGGVAAAIITALHH